MNDGPRLVQSAADQIPVPQPPLRRRHGRAMEIGGNVFWWVWHQIWWAFPLVLLALNWIASFWIHGLRLPVTSWMSQEDALWLLGAIVVNLLLTIAWEYSEFSNITYQFASVRSLRINARASIAVAVFLSALSGTLFWSEGLLWMLLIPALSATFDAFVSADRGINNAAGKSPIEQTEEELAKRRLERREGGAA